MTTHAFTSYQTAAESGELLEWERRLEAEGPGPLLWDADPNVCCAAYQLGACEHTEAELDDFHAKLDAEWRRDFPEEAAAADARHAEWLAAEAARSAALDEEPF